MNCCCSKWTQINQSSAIHSASSITGKKHKTRQAEVTLDGATREESSLCIQPRAEKLSKHYAVHEWMNERSVEISPRDRFSRSSLKVHVWPILTYIDP